jgi:hypothetical protein
LYLFTINIKVSYMGEHFEQEELPSGKTIMRYFDEDGSLMQEVHAYGMIDLAIQYEFDGATKTGETYTSKRGVLSRKSYENARRAYPDMPPADPAFEDWGRSLVTAVRRQRRRTKAETERRLMESAESQFPRPTSTNWLRVMAGKKSHLVVFASRDWKFLAGDRRFPTEPPPISTGPVWLKQFGFFGVPGQINVVSKGLEVGYEVTGDRKAMLNASRSVLAEVNAFMANQQKPILLGDGSMRTLPKSKRKQTAWPAILPPLIKFLAGLHQSTVKIFNHHR